MSDPISTWGNAEREKWKALKKAIPLTDRLGRFIGQIIGPAASELGGLLGDQMKAWRAANLQRIAEKWERILSSRNVGPSVIKLLPFREAIALIDAASIEDDDDVQQLWAKLIANATDVDVETTISKMHIDLIKSINGLEARVLLVQFAAFEEGDFGENSTRRRWRSAIKRWPDLSSEKLRVCLQNLQRLGLLSPCITEMEILRHNTFEEWEATLDNDTLIPEFKKVIKGLVLEITNLSGNPMNDLRLGDDLATQISLINSYSMTRLGFDLYEATTQVHHRPGPKREKRASSKTRREKKQ